MRQAAVVCVFDVVAWAIFRDIRELNDVNVTRSLDKNDLDVLISVLKSNCGSDSMVNVFGEFGYVVTM